MIGENDRDSVLLSLVFQTEILPEKTRGFSKLQVIYISRFSETFQVWPVIVVKLIRCLFPCHNIFIGLAGTVNLYGTLIRETSEFLIRTLGWKKTRNHSPNTENHNFSLTNVVPSSHHTPVSLTIPLSHPHIILTHSLTDSLSLRLPSLSCSPSLTLLIPSLVMEIDNLSAADALIGASIVTKTRQAYTSKVNAIKKYYSEHLHREFVAPINREDILRFFGWLIDDKHKDKPLAVSSVTGYKSALKWYYKEKRLTMVPEVNQELNTLLKGYQRRVSQLKLDGRMPVFEGKYHLPFEGYRVLAALLFRSDRFDEMLFAWPFLVLQWNLIARTATVSSIMMEHIGWEGDALLISTPKHKGDQEGVKCFARHLYANPSFPAICPVLALAILTFVRTLRHDPSTEDTSAPASFRVFDGPNNSARFSDNLSRIIAAVPSSDVHLLGGERKQLGTHSVRKGAASYCTGMINGPSTVQIFLRAGWSLGNVQDRYLFAGAGGDQLTGRVLSGLPFTDSSFASLPPHFNQEGMRMINWDSILPYTLDSPILSNKHCPICLLPSAIMNHG